MNKGADPRQAAWIFYSDRDELDALGRAIVEGRFDSGRLACDPADLESAKKASSEVPVYLEVLMLVPEDFDLEAARGEVVERAQAALEGVQGAEGPQDSPGEGDREDPDEDDGAPDYEPVPAPAGTRVRIGCTTLQAARDYIAPDLAEGRGGEGGAGTDLPGLQMLGQLVDFMRDAPRGLPAMAVWHVDERGILRMAGAKKVKAMAGNTLTIKQ